MNFHYHRRRLVFTKIHIALRENYRHKLKLNFEYLLSVGSKNSAYYKFNAKGSLSQKLGASIMYLFTATSVDNLYCESIQGFISYFYKTL